MDRTEDRGAAQPGIGHVAFRVIGPADAADLKVMSGVIAVLVLAIGVCGSVLPPRSGWRPIPSAVERTSDNPAQVGHQPVALRSLG